MEAEFLLRAFLINTAGAIPSARRWTVPIFQISSLTCKITCPKLSLVTFSPTSIKVVRTSSLSQTFCKLSAKMSCLLRSKACMVTLDISHQLRTLSSLSQQRSISSRLTFSKYLKSMTKTKITAFPLKSFVWAYLDKALSWSLKRQSASRITSTTDSSLRKFR